MDFPRAWFVRARLPIGGRSYKTEALICCFNADAKKLIFYKHNRKLLGTTPPEQIVTGDVNDGLSGARVVRAARLIRLIKPKHTIEQVDRLLSNTAINVDDILVCWVPFVIDADNQATIMLA